MKNEQRLPVKSGTLLALNFILCLSGSVLLSSGELIGLGRIPDLPETPIGFYRKKALPSKGSLPDNWELRMGPAKNQGDLQTCACFTVSACGEYWHNGRRFSEAEFAILAGTHLLPNEGGDCKNNGLYLGKALHLAKEMGLVDERRLPYGPFVKSVIEKKFMPFSRGVKKSASEETEDLDICIKDPLGDSFKSYNQTMKTLGVNIRLKGNSEDVGDTLPNLYPIHHVSKRSLSLVTQGKKVPAKEMSIGLTQKADIALVKRALSLGYPVAAAVPVFEDCWTSHTIELPDQPDVDVDYHAITITGYDDDSRTFTFRNSWGTQWGDNGFGYIPYKYIELYSTELVAVGN